MMRQTAWLLAAALLFSAGGVQAMTVAEQDFVCPIGGEAFKAVMPMSGFQAGMYLDMKPYGAIAAPHPLAECPGNGFVIFDESLPPAELKQLEAAVASTDYQAMRGTETSYYRAAWLQRKLGWPAHRLAWNLLRASWQASADQYARYADAALAEYRRAVALADPPAEFDASKQVAARLVIGELLRRLQRFDEAQAYLRQLQADPAMQEGQLLGLVAQELRLVAARDPLPAIAGEEEDRSGAPRLEMTPPPPIW